MNWIGLYGNTKYGILWRDLKDVDLKGGDFEWGGDFELEEWNYEFEELFGWGEHLCVE